MSLATNFPLNAWIRGPLAQLQLLLVVALLFGGGGAAYGLHNLMVQLLALLVIGLQGKRIREFFATAPRALLILVTMTVAFPLAQLVPLPPAIWQELPSRSLAAESFAIAGYGPNVWAPYSLAPVRTLIAFASTLVPLAIVMIGVTLPSAGKAQLALTFVVASLFAFFLGALQLSSANTFAIIYEGRTAADVLYATFANRNSTGLLFVIALCVLTGQPPPRNHFLQLAGAAGAALLALGVILTQSRSSMVLLSVPVVLALTRLVLELWQRRARTVRGTGVVAVFNAFALIGLLAAVVGSAIWGGRAATSIGRFADMNTDRPEMWEDGIYTAGQFWPFGAGMGSFDDAFQIFESLEYVSQQTAGRAHSDWIEIAIEGGIFALGLAFGWLIWALVSILRGGGDRWLAFGAAGAVFVIGAQSFVDYPLRSQSLLCVAGLLIVLIAGPRNRFS